MVKENNYITHRLGLYQIAYELTEKRIYVDVDYFDSDHGNLIARNDSKEKKILVKSLSNIVPISISIKEFNNIKDYTKIFLITGVYTKDYKRFNIPVDIVIKDIKTNYSPDGKEHHWIDVDKYERFAVNEFDLS